MSLEYADVWNEKVRRARKAHVCTCCEARIVSGDQYLSHASILDGEITTAKLCLPCRGARDVLFEDPAYDDLMPHPKVLFEMLDAYAPDSDQIRALLDRISARMTKARGEP